MLRKSFANIQAVTFNNHYVINKNVLYQLVRRCTSDSGNLKGDRSSFNQIILLGRVGAEPKAKESSFMVSFPLGTSRFWKSDGELRSKTDWHKIFVSIPATKEFTMNHINTGDRVMVIGSARNQSYVDEHGRNTYFAFVNADRITLMSKRRLPLEQETTEEKETTKESDLSEVEQDVSAKY